MKRHYFADGLYWPSDNRVALEDHEHLMGTCKPACGDPRCRMIVEGKEPLAVRAFRNGRADRLLGLRSTIALTAPDAIYRAFYHFGLTTTIDKQA